MANRVDAGAWGRRSLGTDVRDEDTDVNKKYSTLSGSKKFGGGMGGLLLPLILSIATGGAASPLLLAAMGGLGAYGGSKLAGKFSGVKEDDITGGRFFKNTRDNLMKDIKSQEMKDSIMGAAGGYMGAGSFNKMGKGIGEFGKAAKEYGLKDTMARHLGIGKKAFADKTWLQGLKDNPDLIEELGGDELGRYNTLMSGGDKGGGLLDKLRGGYGGSEFGGLPKIDASTLKSQGFGGKKEGGSGIATNILNLFKNKRPNQGGYEGGVDLQSVLDSGPEGMTSLEDVNTGFEDWASRGSEGLPADWGLSTGGSDQEESILQSLSDNSTNIMEGADLNASQNILPELGYDAGATGIKGPGDMFDPGPGGLADERGRIYGIEDATITDPRPQLNLNKEQFMQGQEDLEFMAQDIDTSNLTPEGGFKQPYVPSEADAQQEYQDFLNKRDKDASFENIDRLQTELGGGTGRQDWMSPDRMNAIQDSMGYYEDQWQNPNTMVGIPNAESSPIMNPNDNQTVWDKASMGLGDWWNQDSELDPETESQLNQNQGQYGLLNPFNWGR